MDTSGYRRKQMKLEFECDYQHNLSMYKTSPGIKIQFAEFADVAIDRVRVLRIIEFETLIRNEVHTSEWKKCIIEELKKQGLSKYIRLLQATSQTKPGDFQIRREDNISHHILRLAYCQTEELSTWFLNRELELFKLKLMCASDKSITEFMKQHNLEYPLVSEQEMIQFRDEISCSTGGDFVLGVTKFYKVHFQEVLSLLEQHKVFVMNGFAYVPSYNITACIITAFEHALSESLAVALKRSLNITDARLRHFLKNLYQDCTDKAYGEFSPNTQRRVTLANIDQCARDSFPLCMKHIHDNFRNRHHLKHFSRLQYLFFLRAAGMIFEDVFEFWRGEFTKIIEPEQFQKRYAYSVKHAFGLVGRMRGHPAYNCEKIISGSVEVRDTHGCPFKHWDGEVLRTSLDELGLNAHAVDDVLESKQAGHSQLACSKCFHHLHAQNSRSPIFHPNQYFENSFVLKTKDSFTPVSNFANDSNMDVTFTQSTINTQM